MKRTIAISILSLSAASSVNAAPAPPPAATYPVCIVGAGPAGLTTAANLQLKGQSSIVFEKQATVGGKCQSYYENNTYHPLGALLFTNGTYTETIKIINSVNVKSVPFTHAAGDWTYDWKNGTLYKSTTAPPEFLQLLQAEIGRYTQQWATDFAPKFAAPNYKNGVPAELTISTQDWLNKNNYQAIQALFNAGMVSYGYGDFREVPILYMLQYFTPEVLVSVTGLQPSNLIDFQAVWTQYAAKAIKGPIKLNSKISKIDRSGALPVITYTSGCTSAYCKPQTQTCSSLIMAFPPTLAALKASNLDITPSESTLFSSVQTNNYYSGAVRMQIPTLQLYSTKFSAPNVPPEAAGEPVAFVRLWNTTDVVTTWSWAATNSTASTEQVRQILKTTLSKVNKADPANGAQQPIPVTDADVKAFWKTDYFPHFSSQKLLDGAYVKFAALQGQKKTYFASGLNGMETVEFAVRAGLSIVNDHF